MPFWKIMMTQEQRDTIHNALLDADFSTRYWSMMAHGRQRRDFWINVIVTASSSGAVASWFIWSKIPGLWQTLSVVAAIISIIQTLSNLGGQVEQMFQAQSQWRAFEMSYQQLYDNLPNMPPDEAFKKFQEIQQAQVPLANDCARFPEGSEKTKLRIRSNVLKDRRLPNP